MLCNHTDRTEGTTNMSEELNNEATTTEATAVPEVKEKKTRKRESTKSEYGIQGKLMNPETPGFDVSKHKKLTSLAFNDVLDYAKWEVWYLREKLALAEKEVEKLQAMGSTPEERAAAKQQEALFGKLEAAMLGNPEVAKRMQDRLAALFAQASQ